MIEIKFKKLHPDAQIPIKAKHGDAGYDIIAVEDARITSDYIEYQTGLAVEIPYGYELQVRPRSSIRGYSLTLANSPGTIDSGFRGNILINFKKIGKFGKIYKKGDKIAQLVPAKVLEVNFIETNELSDSERGQGGFGSTDNYTCRIQ